MVWLLVAGAAIAADWTAAGKAWWKHVDYLASDKLEGRNVGSQGYEQAAAYVATQFENAGLKPGAGVSFFQPVQFTETTLSSWGLALVRGANSFEIPVPGEAHLGFSADSAQQIEAPLVFAGYGLVIPEAQHDDLKDLPVQGAVVVYLTGGPNKIDGDLRSHYSSTAERWKALHAAGAVGTIAIANPTSMEIPWARQSLSWGMPRMTLTDPALNSTRGLKFSASWDPDKANDLLAGSGHGFEEILEAAGRQEPLPHFKLNATIRAKISASNRIVASKNIVGWRPGDDASLRNEYVIVSAHLDHLGVGKPVNGDRIYNGAMDDASGVASLIEIARLLQKTHAAAKRSILFLAVTGEEKGDLGSEYFAAHPTIAGRIVADLNMDMYLPLFPLKWLEVQGLNESTLGDDVRAVARAAGVEVQADKEPNRNRFIRSDQYSFIRAGIPALATKIGYTANSPEAEIDNKWFAERYHGVTDSADQPVDLAAVGRYEEFMRRLAERVANRKVAPRWYDTSVFSRLATH